MQRSRGFGHGVVVSKKCYIIYWYQFCIVLASCPSLRCSCREKTCLMQRSRGFGHGVVGSKNCYNILIVLLCDCCKLLASVGWKQGCQPFSCPCSQNVTHCRKEIYATCLSKESIPAIPFGNSKHPPEASGSWEYQHPPPALHYACIIPIPSLQLKKKTSLLQRSRRFGHGVVVSKICYVQYSDCVQDLDYRMLIALSVVKCDCCKPMNHCRDWGFSHSGLEAGRPAFQLPMFANCDALPKRDLFDMFV